MLQLSFVIVMRRLLTAIPTLLMLSLVVFVVLRLLPVDPLGMMLPPSATAADSAALRQQLGFDKPIPVQFLIWLWDAARGSLGNSINFRQPVTTLMLAAIPATIELALAGLSLALLISIPGGVMAYVLYQRRRETAADLIVTLLQSVPSFLWALLLIIVFGVLWPVLPFSGRVGQDVTLPGITGFVLIDLLLTGQFQAWLGALSHLLLPALALALSFAPLVIRVLRSSLIDAANEPYVEVARLRGLSESRILWRHMLKNAALPTITMIGVQFGFLFSSALLVEMIFGLPGVGNLMVQAVKGNDLPLIQGIALIVLRPDAGDQRRGRCAVRHAESPAENPVTNAATPADPPSALRSSLRQMTRQPRLLIGGGILLVVALAALFAARIAPHDPLEQDLLHMLAPPMWAQDGSAAFPLGTDSLGRCVLSRVIYGGRVALIVAVVSALGAMLVGSALALVGGYFGGRIDRAISAIVDLWMSFPPVVLSLILLVGLGTGIDKVILAVVLVDWTRFCRVVRADVLVTRRRDYVLAARLMGFTHLRTMLREVLPTVVPLMITLFSIEMGIAIVVEATLSFIGLSVPPDITTWGQMLADARSDMQSDVWVMLVPVGAIITTVLGCNLLADGLRAALDPRLRRRGE